MKAKKDLDRVEEGGDGMAKGKSSGGKGKSSGGGKSRSAITGRYISRAAAARHPNTSVTERR